MTQSHRKPTSIEGAVHVVERYIDDALRQAIRETREDAIGRPVLKTRERIESDRRHLDILVELLQDLHPRDPDAQDIRDNAYVRIDGDKIRDADATLRRALLLKKAGKLH